MSNKLPFSDLQLSLSKGRRADYKAKKNPLLRLSYLVNTYHAISVMENVSDVKKKEAQSKLHRHILGFTKHKLSAQMVSTVKLCLNDESFWNETRERLID